MRMRAIVAAVVLLVLTACHSPPPRLNAPPHGVPETRSRLQPVFNHMVDNALLADMTVSDVHFHPHRATLNELGLQRLTRLVELRDAHGGDLRFSTNLADATLAQARFQTILDFLRDAGLDLAQEPLRPDLPGGEGMDAREVILIRRHEAAYQPRASQGGGDGGAAAPGTR